MSRPNTSTLVKDTEKINLFSDSVAIEMVYLYQGLLVEQHSGVMESPCADTTDETVSNRD
ncbi:hypothetical protein EXN66_Car006013 [Channa argus]|uniref:Uncharacterized protein n=1 Tax=Channa argus TaxID=215402 RepID=A0A6G1PJ35_CHAAH|nr:hypothetical protein EXN66_Car006013 [Channa argus]